MQKLTKKILSLKSISFSFGMQNSEFQLFLLIKLPLKFFVGIQIKSLFVFHAKSLLKLQ